MDPKTLARDYGLEIKQIDAVTTADFQNLAARPDVRGIKHNRLWDLVMVAVQVECTVSFKVSIRFASHEDLFLVHAIRVNPALAGRPFRSDSTLLARSASAI